MRLDECGTGLERLPECCDPLLELAHHHVAAIEPQISESFRRALPEQSRRMRLSLMVVRHHWSGRLLVMSIGMAEQDFAKRHAVPVVAFDGRAVTETNGIWSARISTFLIIRNGLRQTIGE